jgi:hypothetical protein
VQQFVRTRSPIRDRHSHTTELELEDAFASVHHLPKESHTRLEQVLDGDFDGNTRVRDFKQFLGRKLSVRAAAEPYFDGGLSPEASSGTVRDAAPPTMMDKLR